CGVCRRWSFVVFTLPRTPRRRPGGHIDGYQRSPTEQHGKAGSALGTECATAPQSTPPGRTRGHGGPRWASVDQGRNPEGYGEKQHHPPEEDGRTERNDRHPRRGYGEGHRVQRRNGETGGEEDNRHSPPALTQESKQPVRPGPESGPN